MANSLRFESSHCAKPNTSLASLPFSTSFPNSLIQFPQSFFNFAVLSSSTCMLSHPLTNYTSTSRLLVSSVSGATVEEQIEVEIADGYTTTQFCDKIIDVFLNEKPKTKDWRKYLVFREDWKKYREKFYNRCLTRADAEIDSEMKRKLVTLSRKVKKIDEEMERHTELLKEIQDSPSDINAIVAKRRKDFTEEFFRHLTLLSETYDSLEDRDGNNVQLMHKFISMLNSKFALKDLGPLSHFLGMQAHRNETGLYLKQQHYASQLLSKLHLEHLKPVPTPMTTNVDLTSDSSPLLPNATQYRQILGSLQYLTYTRPDISFAVNQLSQYMHAPRETHWFALKRLLRYIKGTISHGLHFQPSQALVITGFSDADWACNVLDRKSIAGYCVYLGGSLVSWSSKKQQVVARSSTESEYRALASVAAEIKWLTSLLSELHITPAARPTTWCDNLSAAALAYNPVFHSRTKHIEVDVHFVRDQVQKGQLQVAYVPSYDQVADCLTKPLSNTQFQINKTKLNVVDATFSLRGDVKAI